MSPFRVLVVEDDGPLRAALVRALRLEGYVADEASDGAKALRQLAALRADVVVLDVVMPEVDGLTVCQRLRAMGDRTPVLLLTARDLVSDRVQGLNAGADDYLTKPFAVDELLARVAALIRRSYPGHDSVLSVADLSMNPRTRAVRRGDRMLELTRTEFALLEVLMMNVGIVMNREALRERLWGYGEGWGSNTLDVYIGYLRRKAEESGESRLIHTVRGVGFVVRSP
jgi:two-component system, OmpR family, response regulator MprA